MSILKSTNSGRYTQLTLDVLKSLNYVHPKFPSVVQSLNPEDDCLDLTILKNTAKDCGLVLHLLHRDGKLLFKTSFTFENSNHIAVQASVTPQDIRELSILENIWKKQHIKNKELSEHDFDGLMFVNMFVNLLPV